ncbi:MAG: hypothetical protein ACJATN_001765 [Neolewinella sp.]|mgnify:CR=1|jgi:hypothetical protein
MEQSNHLDLVIFLAILLTIPASIWGGLATATFAAIRSEDREGFEAPAADFIFKVIVWVVVFLFTTVVSLCAALVIFQTIFGAASLLL